MNITGKIIEISETTQISSSFRKREFVVEYSENPQYPEYIKFELIQDKCDLLNEYKVGDTAEVSFNLKGRKWTDPQGVDKYFNSLQAWKLAKNGSSQGATNSAAASTTPADEEPEWLSDGNDENDLPF